MPDRPYTDDDLRTAAALMHYALTTEPNPADADAVLSEHPAWAHVEVGSDEEDQLRESVVELVSGAADVSAWAVDLGADNLQPSDHEITIDIGDGAVARLHFAFEPTMPNEMRSLLVDNVSDLLDEQDAAARAALAAAPAGVEADEDDSDAAVQAVRRVYELCREHDARTGLMPVCEVLNALGVSSDGDGLDEIAPE